jgi:hypothetical protein
VRCGFRRAGKFVTVRMPVKDRFDATLTAAVPVAYVVPKATLPDSALARLRLHGVIVEEARAPLALDGIQWFTIDSMVRRGAPFQGHAEVRLEGTWGSAQRITSNVDAYVIRTSQPLGVLAVQLLEPQSDDGLVTWNYFDAALEGALQGPVPRTFPVARLAAPIAFPTRIVP